MPVSRDMGLTNYKFDEVRKTDVTIGRIIYAKMSWKN